MEPVSFCLTSMIENFVLAVAAVGRTDNLSGAHQPLLLNVLKIN
jgi:hypothetical protein